MTSTHMFHQEIARQRHTELRRHAEIARLAKDVKRDRNGIVLATPRRLRGLFRRGSAAPQMLRPIS